ncbi:MULTISPECIES: chromosome segregation protein SMC [unclassified Clostridium]|uniref:chromosome segregation protein SMC n=1 Tax=unclassified Clostridium TaxID=2614128 RepID=UPI002A82B364|nr:chromosome segregation protein SMC [Clostridium sp.]MDY4250960.1 chromosome segregation protein SMC [Clostridium sp.]
MFLKSLEIRGFKSFADKTNLNFKKGVTAVVGPNGSGKSNISDSVRWVLGEQSVKTLRGGKMEDVIFAGTQFRKAVGLAQVSLTLDNSDNSLDTDYSEVTITRRIFRSGETEYLINNQKCRLKDIHSLFMDTGIGKEGYSLIGQGKIEAILSGKADDRRAILEEAAGIVKFKSRKEEAERKLSNTENNLTRIRDIISTYEERIEPLKEEREKALKYNVLSDDLRVREVSLLVNNIGVIDKDIKSINVEITNKSENIKEKREILNKLKEELVHLEEEIETIEKKNNAEKTEYYTKKEEVNKSLNDIEIYKERIKNFEEVIKKDNEEILRLEEVLIKSRKEKDLLLIELEEKIKEQINKENLIKEFESTNYKLINEIKKLEEDSEKIKEDEFEILRRTSEINNDIAIINKEIVNKEELSTSGENNLKAIEGNISINIATISSINEKINTIKKLKEEIEANIIDNRKKIGALSSQLTRKERFIREIAKKINILDGKLTTLRDLEKSYEGYQLSIKKLMERIEKGQIPYGKGASVLGEIFTVDKKYETAIEISLGGAISNVITEDENTAKLLIEYLKKNSLGRATFLPLNIIKGSRINVSNDIKNVKGYIGLASDLLNYDNKYKEIMDYSLGKTIIAENMEAALIISRLGNYKIRIVTLDGEVISPGGALTGGSIYKKNNSSILGRRREIQELEESINTNKSSYNSELLLLDKIRDEIREIDEDILNKSDDIHEKNIDITRFESEVRALENESLKLKNSLEVSKKEISLNNETLVKLRDEIVKKEENLRLLQNTKEENKERIEIIQRELIEKKEVFDKIKEENIQVKIEKAKLDEVVYSRQSDLRRKEKEEKEKEERIFSLKKDNDEKSSNINYLRKLIEDKTMFISEVNKRLNELEDVFKFDEASRISLKDKLKIKDGESNLIIEEIRVLEIDLNRKEISFAKLESERENYYIKLNEELNLTLAEAMEIAVKIENISKVKEEIFKIKNQITELGTVNLAAIAEYEEVCEKYQFMSSQEEDLNMAKEELMTVINEMTIKMQELFRENFTILNKNFNETFKDLFKGGNAELILGEGDELTADIEINVQPPGKKLQNINLMSGGEKVLSAIALLFAILKMKPTPFCILDEIEAALDDANVYRYAEFLREFSENIQFIVITHRKGTMEASDVMYGITMEEKGVSKVVSVDLSKEN